MTEQDRTRQFTGPQELALAELLAGATDEQAAHA